RLRRSLAGDLERIASQALKKEPEERYASVGALADDLRRYLNNEPIAAPRESVRYRAAKFVRRNRLPVALATFVLLALVAGLSGTSWQARVAARQRDLAMTQLARAESINEFNASLLGQWSAPSGRAVTLHEILARAEELIESRFSRDESLAVELLTSIGTIYAVRQEDANARRVLKGAYDASQRVSDGAVRAGAACQWARMVAAEGDYAAGLRLVDSALATTTREARFNNVVVSCLVAKASIADDAGSPDVVVEAAQQALARMQDTPFVLPERRVDAL